LGRAVWGGYFVWEATSICESGFKVHGGRGANFDLAIDWLSLQKKSQLRGSVARRCAAFAFAKMSPIRGEPRAPSRLEVTRDFVNGAGCSSIGLRRARSGQVSGAIFKRARAARLHRGNRNPHSLRGFAVAKSSMSRRRTPVRKSVSLLIDHLIENVVAASIARTAVTGLYPIRTTSRGIKSVFARGPARRET